VFDLGGGTFDVTILTMKDKEFGKFFDVRSTAGDVHLGGEDFTRKLVEQCEMDFLAEIERGTPLEPYERGRLRSACENAKQDFSTMDEVSVQVLRLARKDPT